MADERERLFSQLLNLDCPPADFSFIPDEGEFQDFVDTEFDFEDDTPIIGINANHYYEYSLSCLQSPDGSPNRFFYNPTGETTVSIPVFPGLEIDGIDPSPDRNLEPLGPPLEDPIRNPFPRLPVLPDDFERGEGGITPSNDREQPQVLPNGQFVLPTERTVQGSTDESAIQGVQLQNVQDPFRLLTETVWFYKDNRLGKLYEEVDVPYVTHISPRRRIEFNDDGSLKCRLSSTYFPDRDTALVTFANNPPFVFGTEFTDHYFILNVPFEEGILNDFPLVEQAYIAYSKSKYNFYDRAYEEGIESLDERLLHNYLKSSQDNYREVFQEVIESTEEERQQIIERNRRITYGFEEIRDSFAEIGNDNSLTFAGVPMLNSLIFENKQIEESDPNPISENNIAIDTAYASFENNSVQSIPFSLAEQVGEVEGDSDTGRFSPRVDLRLYDYEEFMDQLEETLPEIVEDNRIGPFLRPGRTSFRNRIERTVNNLVEDYFRTPDQIFSLKPCYHKILFYRVEKRKVITTENTARSEVIQNFLIPYTGDKDLVKFIDSQVKYGQRYDYQVYAYNIVIGNKYSYRPRESNYIVFGENRVDLGGVIFENEPSLKIVEVPFTNFSNVVYDAAPLPPSVEIYPSLREERKVSFFLEDRYGEEYLNPIIFDNEGEEEKINLIRLSQEIPTGPLLYRGDDTAKAFQVFRTTTKPESKLAMQNFLIDEVDTTLDRDPTSACNFRSRSILWDDARIEYNRKYYYMFRTIDIHNSYSNPSDIYEVELVETLGHVQLVINIVRPEIPTITKKKSFRKYLRIAPALEQMLLSNPVIQESETVEEFATQFGRAKLGPDGNEIWTNVEKKFGKDIKLVVTSKKTGSKMEIVLKYVYTTDNGIKYEVC